MKNLLFFLLIASFASFNAQNLDSLFNEYVGIKDLQNYEGRQVTLDEPPIKCGFGIINQVRINYDKFTPKQKNILSSFLLRPTTDTSLVSPSGKFRIHFNKKGFSAPAYSLTDLAEAADYVYKYEVETLGYPPPPKDFGNSSIKNNPDDLYDIYIQDLAGGLYGYTELDKQLTNNTYTSYTVIDNDYGSNYYTLGIDGARVTIAHEFHHAIQIGNYIYRPEDEYYHEITSTSMEEFVYDDINDYYNYMDSYFRNPNKTFSSNNGYNLAIWNLFLRDRFGINIIKRIWEKMPLKRALDAIDEAILDADSYFKLEFNRFGIWTFFTGARAIPQKYFKEASFYPLIKPLMSTKFIKPTTILKVNSEPVSNNFLEFSDNLNTIVSIVSNTDLKSGVNTASNSLMFDYYLSSNQNAGFRKIVDGYYSKIESADVSLFAESNIYNNVLVNEGQISVSVAEYVYPQPFKYSINSNLYIPSPYSPDGFSVLNIYSIDMNLVYSSQKRIVAADKIVVTWNGLDDKGKKLGTGVYLFVVKADGEIKKGKFVIYND